MSKQVFLFLTLVTVIHFVKSQNETHRRVYFGVPQERFKIPVSSVISIRKSSNGYRAPICSGVLIGPKQALSAAHCFQQGYSYKIGYGSTFVAQQNLFDVENVHICGSLDVALLRLASVVPTNKNVMLFTTDHWKMDDARNMIRGGTFLCGYGYYEGPDRQHPVMTPTTVLRCHSYRFTGNFLTLKDIANRDIRYPIPPSSAGGYVHNKNYVMSLSRSPEDSNPRGPNFSTACEGDSGSPVFYEENGTFKLVSIHHSGPSICGDAKKVFNYDSSTHTPAISDNCFNIMKVAIVKKPNATYAE